MTVEILGNAEVRVRPPDAEELRAIRRGAFPFDALLEQAESLGTRVKGIGEQSPLPARPDEERLNVLCGEIVTSVHRRLA